MPENPSQQPQWEERPDGTRVRIVNGIRIVDQSEARQGAPGPIEHLVAREEDAGVVIVGLDADNRAVYTTTLKRRQS
jgi:hypothetical protein